ncbi:MAG: hypothetical protein HEQ35_16335 [Gloeotrichia echinulata IR180]|jgi:hypothetical protein
MNLEQCLEVANEMVFLKVGRRLNDIETSVLKGAWDGKTYEEIADNNGYSVAYLMRGVGPKLWKMMTEALGEQVRKTNFKSALERKWLTQHRGIGRGVLLR